MKRRDFLKKSTAAGLLAAIAPAVAIEAPELVSKTITNGGYRHTYLTRFVCKDGLRKYRVRHTDEKFDIKNDRWEGIIFEYSEKNNSLTLEGIVLDNERITESFVDLRVYDITANLNAGESVEDIQKI